MSLLDLPLVIVQDIIKLAVDSWTLEEVFALRSVNHLFDDHVTKYLLRTRCSDMSLAAVEKELKRQLEALPAQDLEELEIQNREASQLPGFVRDKVLRGFLRAFDLYGEHETLLVYLDPERKGSSTESNSDVLASTLVVTVSNDMKKVYMAMVREGVSPDAQSRFLNSALDATCRTRDTEAAEFLLNSGAQIQCWGGGNGKHLLHQTARRGSAGITRLLLDPKYGLINSSSLCGSVINCALRNKHIEIATMILDCNPYIRYPYRDRISKNAVACQKVEIITRMIKPGFNYFNKKVISAGLEEAARQGNVEIFNVLWKHESLADETRESNVCLLCYPAAEGGNIEIFEFLLQCGLDLQKYGRGASLFVAAAQCGQIQLVQYLMDRKVDTEFGEPARLHVIALLAAIRAYRYEAVRWLLQRFTYDLNPTLIGGGLTLNPLITAIDSGSPQMIKLLQQQGAVPMDRTILTTKFSEEDVMKRMRQQRQESIDLGLSPKVWLGLGPWEHWRRFKIDKAIAVATGPGLA
ncbi:ankyrin [Zopfia rhizophila CBS 207.26]|uniref:Ankyrin n=1 Tax=Zopfia rhizophila CBS 207.26 TaxID=1314779 RepID=A0A6A6EXF2_9PEZI|nr:ankyrin [Zopfia rhizophila CBS 207.26]